MNLPPLFPSHAELLSIHINKMEKQAVLIDSEDPLSTSLPFETPIFIKEHSANQADDLFEKNLEVPKFLTQSLPISEKLEDLSCDVQTFFEKGIQAVTIDTQPPREPTLPRFKLFTSPKNKNSEKESLTQPVFQVALAPLAQETLTLVPLLAPQYTNPQPLNVKKFHPKKLRSPPDLMGSNPIMKNFDLLCRINNYEEIFSAAVNYGTLEDLRMLRRRSLLHKRYWDQQFVQLNREKFSLLPQSDAFKKFLKNDQSQIDLLSICCRDLIAVSHWSELKWAPRSLLKRLVEQSPLTFNEYMIQQKKLLEFKDCLYAFLNEILQQEQKANQKIGATPLELSDFSHSLKDLGAHIHSALDALLMHKVLLAADLNFFRWEDRKPLPPACVRLENPGKVADFRELDKNLSALQGAKPLASQLMVYTNQVLSLPESYRIDAETKASYFCALGEVYFKKATMPAFKEALKWYDQAITLLKSPISQKKPIWLMCFESRGAVRLAISKKLKAENNYADDLSRRWLDICYRDFHRSSSLTDGLECNFVRKAKNAIKTSDYTLARRQFKEIFKIDPDYAEARYHEFLKRFDFLQLQQSKMLHSHFDALEAIAPSQLLDTLKVLLAEKSCQRPTSIFEVTLSSGSAFIKIEAQTLSISRSGIVFLADMLTNGIKKIRIVSPNKKIHFCSAIDHINLTAIIQSLYIKQSKMLHSSFDALEAIAPSQLLDTLKVLLAKKSSLKAASLFKVTLSSGFAFIKIEAQTLSMSRSGVDFLADMLTNGIKKIRVVSPSKKIYFCPPISQGRVNTLIQSLSKRENRLGQFEKSIARFHSFEIAAFYKASLLDEKAELNRNSIRMRLDPELIFQVVELHAIASNGYLQLAKKNPAKALDYLSIALLHVCHAISEYERLLTNSQERALKNKQLSLLIKKALIYKQMDLCHCEASAWEEALAFAKKIHPRYFNPSLHHALGLVYLKLNRLEDAKEQFYIEESSRRRISAKHKARLKEAKQKLRAAKIKVPENLSGVADQEIKILADFQDENILEVCLQILSDHYRANSNVHPQRQVLLWDYFIQRINQTTTLPAFFEVVLSSTFLSKTVTSSYLLRMARVANLAPKDPKYLDSIKEYVLDAEKVYLEREKRLEDLCRAKSEETKAKIAKAEAFIKFKEVLTEKLKEGKRVRPGSPIRAKIRQLCTCLIRSQTDRPFVLNSLKEIIEDNIASDLEIVEEEILEILQMALEIDLKPIQIKYNVLQLNGNNIFLSQAQELIKSACATQEIHDVHLIGIHVYIDTCVQLPGINLAIGAEYIEFLLDKGVDGLQDRSKPIVIDLSGRPASKSQELNLDPAANGNNPCDNGANGVNGQDGQGGQAGGDFCLSVQDPLTGIVGFDVSKIEVINLSGGDGGSGSKGQAGGNGAPGKKGENARSSIEKDDPSDTLWGYIDLRRGQKGQPGGDGGQGGDGGLGGEGGKPGKLIIEIPNAHLKEQIKVDKGKNGTDGDPGEGGKGGAGEPDGLDYAIVKGGITDSKEEFYGYELFIQNSCRDRCRAGWSEGTSEEQTRSRNQGKERGRGKTAEEQKHRRQSQNKHELKREIFSKNLAHHLNTESPANKAYAFDAVTNNLAILYETEAVIQEQLESKQKKIKDIETMMERTAALLHQSQTQTAADMQHSRLTTHNSAEKKATQRVEVELFFKNRAKDSFNFLPFQEYSPVIHKEEVFVTHELERAMHAVNMTRGQNMRALAGFIRKLALFIKGNNYDQVKCANLLRRLVESIQMTPLSNCLDGYAHVLEAFKLMTHADAFTTDIEKKGVEIASFEKAVEEETNILNQHYEKEVHTIELRAGILKFLSKDHLLFTLLARPGTPQEQERKKGWFDKRLYRKIMTSILQLTRMNPAEAMINSYITYANHNIAQIKRVIALKKKISIKEFRKILKSDHKKLGSQLRALKQEQAWILTRLTELCEAKIFLKQRLLAGVDLAELYADCSRQWANLPSSQSKEKTLALSASVDASRTPSQASQWIAKFSLKCLDSAKLKLFESHVNRLTGLTSLLGDISPYLDQLHVLYEEPFEGLAEVYIHLVEAYTTDWKSIQGIIENLKTDDLGTLFRLRKQYWKLLEDPTLVSKKLHESIYVYLQDRNIALIANECLNILNHCNCPKLLNQTQINQIGAFIFQANGLYQSQLLLPDIDFLNLAKDVITENKVKICALLNAQDKPVESVDLRNLLLNKAVASHLGKNISKDSNNRIQALKTALLETTLGEAVSVSKAAAYLFLLIHSNLSHAQNLRVLQLLRESPLSKNEVLMTAFILINQQAEEQKANIEIQWSETLERGKFYDQLRKQVDKEDPYSIEQLLQQIATLSELTSVDQKTKILTQVIFIMSTKGCFTSIQGLLSVQSRLLTQVGRFPTSNSRLSQRFVDYNLALEAVFLNREREKERTKEIEQLSRFFVSLIKSTKISPDFLAPSVVALLYFPLSSSQLITIYTAIHSLTNKSLTNKELSTREQNIRNDCLINSKNLLAHKLHEDYQEALTSKTDIQKSLSHAQAEVIGKVRELLKETQVLHAERHLATFELWIKLLDVFFEIETPSDFEGSARKAYYQQALKQFYEGMKAFDTEKGIAQFTEWLRNKFNAINHSVTDLKSLKSILIQLGSPNQRIKRTAEHSLETLFWRGVTSYHGSESSVLGLIANIKLDEKTKALLKLKFDEAMVQEECYTVNKKLQDTRKKREGTLVEWMNSLRLWLNSDQLSEADLKAFYPEKSTIAHALEQDTNLKVPVLLPVNKNKHTGNGSAIARWIEVFKKNPSDVTLDSLLEQALPEIKSYFKALEKGFDFNVDAPLLKILKDLLSKFNPTRTSALINEIEGLELKLMTDQDDKEAQKTKIVQVFWEVLENLIGYKKSTLKESNTLISRQLTADIYQLEESLSACCVIVGEQQFLALVQKLTQAIKQRQEPVNLQMLEHLFWVAPRLNQPAAVQEVIETCLPDHWALTLLEAHCLESVTPSLARLAHQLPPLNLSHLSNDRKEEWINAELTKKQQTAENCLESFQKALSALISSPELTDASKENLLRLLADRLTLLNQGKVRFSVEAFTSLLVDYLSAPCVLRKLSYELSNPHSVIAKNLFQPSFETFKYALTLAWMEGSLEPDILNLQTYESQKIYDSLFEIETVKKTEAMRSVVEALKGNLIGPAVAECTAHFAQDSWELDKNTLTLLKNRTDSGKWYSQIETYTKTKRSKERDLKILVNLMAQESPGINRSIEQLLKGSKPQLFQEINAIKHKYDLLANWTAEDVTQWAKNKRGKHFLDHPEQLKEGIAVLSRAYKILEGYPLRDTQMIALWLILRKSNDANKGRISQMSTGEGKSIVFACLAILRAMTESYVDVITTSFILAANEADKQKPLFDLFGLTVSNNCDIACESDENLRKNRYYCDGKAVDIIYGDTGAFERDLLLTEFHGQEIIHPSRMSLNRSVLVDEVDGLFLDNAGMVLYLSHAVDTLRFLERIFVQIWTLANQPSFENALPFDDKTVEAILKTMQEKIDSEEMRLPNYKITQAPYMQMRAIIARKLPIWIRAALYAKVLRVNNEYIITDQVLGGKKKKAITVMDKGTGVEQFSLKWSNGLHQFLQLKHGLELTPDSLKAVFLSNYFFFKRYAQHIYGLSGTLGSDAEQKYLQDLYQVDLCKIPRFKGEKYIQHKAIIAGDGSEWLERIEKSVERQLKDLKRAVLIICDSVEEVVTLKNHLKQAHPLLQVYTSSLQELSFLPGKQQTLLAPGDLIIATNLAGRGTDFKTSPLLEAHGGLHVILSYLPTNIRIQEQAFGRTARAGNEGSGEFIILEPQRLPINELCRARDYEESQRLESIASKEIKKIKFEHKLLSGFYRDGNYISGFQTTLDSVKEALKNEEPFYREAQLNSLKNRWAFWIDSMEEKISLVHALGKEAVLTSFQEFQECVAKDFQEGGLRLVKEPIELIKLGSEYRRLKKWTEAQNCYAAAAKDPHYAYALYYKAACELIKSPSSSFSAKASFKSEAKRAALAIKPEIAQLQSAIQNIVPLVEQRRVKTGQADFGNPYKARTEEKIHIWSIFLSGIDAAIGGTLSGEALKKSSFIQDDEGDKILKTLGENYKPTRLSKKLTLTGDSLSFLGKPLTLPKMFTPVLRYLSRQNADRNIDRESLKAACQNVFSQEAARKYLTHKTSQVYRFLPIPLSFKDWPAGYSEAARFVISNFIEESQHEFFESHQKLKDKLREKKSLHPILKTIDSDTLFNILLDKKLIAEDLKIDLAGTFVKVETQQLKFTSLDNIRKGFTAVFAKLPQELQEALLNACREREEGEAGHNWFLKSSIYLSDLSLPKNTEDAADILWTLLEEQLAIKPSKIKLHHQLEEQRAIEPSKIKLHQQDFDSQIKKIKADLNRYFHGRNELEKTVESVFGIIESSMGMIYKLDDKETTAKFAEIIRKYFHDHGQQAPEGLAFFIELGLEVIADLIEQKDPPAWYEVAAITALGVTQMVAGVLIKAYLPFVGELFGNALISSGMDDVMFAITSAVNGQFSWNDYASAKGESLKRSIISSAIGCGISFSANAAQSGMGKAWDLQKLSGVDKAIKAGTLAPGAFNIGTHIFKEVGRSFINMGISQVANRGLEGMTRLISSAYEEKISKGIEEAINDHWHRVETQAQSLYEKLAHDASVKAQIQECVQYSLQKANKANFFEGAIRASKQVIPQASSFIGDSGWSKFISHAPDLANLGVSSSKLIHLVEDSVHQLAREIRETKERKAAVSYTSKTLESSEFEVYLKSLKRSYTKQLTDAFNNILNSAVYAPLVSLGTQYLIKNIPNELKFLSEKEESTQSPEHRSKILEAERNPDKTFYDEELRKWVGADTEVTELTEDDLQKTPVNGTESIETLKKQYGNLLKIFKDKDGNLYTQRPTRAEYVQEILDSKASGDPAFMALAKVVVKNIEVKTPDGKVKIYSEDGKITFSESGTESSNTIHLKLDSNPKSGIGHVTLEGQTNLTGAISFEGRDCLYNAINQATGHAPSADVLRKLAGEKLNDDPDCKRFYHDWSINSESKEFVGNLLQNMNIRLTAAQNALSAIGEIVRGDALIFTTGGVGIVPGAIFVAHGIFNLKAAVETMYKGEKVESGLVSGLKSFLPPDTAEQIDTSISLSGDVLNFRSTFKHIVEKIKPNSILKTIKDPHIKTIKDTLIKTFKEPPNPADFIVGPSGTTIPTNRLVLEGSLSGKFPATPTRSKGMEYTLRDGLKVRVMEETHKDALRATFEKVGAGRVDPFTGKVPASPRGTLDPKKWVGERTHITLKP